MIILDTNVISALMLPALNPAVVQWLDRINQNILTTTAITIFETRRGIDRIAPGRRREQMDRNFSILKSKVFKARILPFDIKAAELAGQIDARRRNEGRESGTNDAMIAAIVLGYGYPFATRNGRHFADLSITIINPWAQV